MKDKDWVFIGTSSKVHILVSPSSWYDTKCGINLMKIKSAFVVMPKDSAEHYTKCKKCFRE